MHRRRFFRLLGFGALGALAAPTFELDIERLLWVPGKKTIFDLGANLAVDDGRFLLTPDWITREALKILRHDLTVIDDYINREYDERHDAQVGVKVRIQRRSSEPVQPDAQKVGDVFTVPVIYDVPQRLGRVSSR